MFDGYKVFLDYDGVLMNTEELIVKYRYMSGLSWTDFFKQLDWYSLYEEAKEINDAFKVLRELQQYSDIYILTKINSLIEADLKVETLRREEIQVPILFVPPKVMKSEVYLPDEKSLLIDDSQANVDDWILHGGEGILFNQDMNKEEKGKVKSLHFLLKH